MSRTWHHGNKQKQRRFGKNWWWMWNHPKWWDHLMHTKPRRAAERQALHKAMKDPDYGEEIMFPLDRKPHQYYW